MNIDDGNNTPKGEAAIVVEKEGFSLIWLVPLLTLLIGIWLAIEFYKDQPVSISVLFPSGDGLDKDKTEVRFKGLKAGIVTDIQYDAIHSGVVVTVDIDHRLKVYLSEGAEFWLVKPEISVNGIKGLDTLIRGNYIGFKPQQGVPKREFIALDKPPPPDEDDPGLRVTLQASELGSLNIGSPVTYKKINVGSVQGYQLNKDGSSVSISLHIEPEYAYLVRKGSRFWNGSGITLTGGLSGFEVKTNSLASIVGGGVSFHTPAFADNSSIEKQQHYELYENFKMANAGIEATVYIETAVGLKAGSTELRYKGFVIGWVHRVDYKDETSTAAVAIYVNPKFEEILVVGSQFWLVKPELSLAGVSGLDTLFGGVYIEVLPGKGKAAREFTALKQPPRLDYSIPGLHVSVLTKELPSISYGSPVFYRKVKVGEVKSYNLLKNGEQIEIHLHIDEKYAHLVKVNSHFWDVGGINVEAGFRGVRVKAQSLISILQGGLAFYTPDIAQDRAKNGQVYRLYKDYDQATKEGVPITIFFKNAEGISEGTEIKYRGIVIGDVKSFEFNSEMNGITANALLTKQGDRFSKSGSHFWLVKPMLGLAKTANLDTLVSGQYIAVNPGLGNTQYQFVALQQEPGKRRDNQGLNIVLTAPTTGSVTKGNLIYYRQFPVGEVIDVDLSELSDHINIYVNIKEKYSPLVRENSVFWNASGIDFNVRLFGGLTVDTDSIESILEGGISFATPDGDALGIAAEQNRVYSLQQKMNREWLEWNPKITLNDAVLNVAKTLE